MMDHKELFAHADVWAMDNGFGGSHVNEWEDFFSTLIEKGFTFTEAASIVSGIIALSHKESLNQ